MLRKVINKEKRKEIWESWVGGIISSVIGVASVIIGSTADWLNSFGRVIFILFGVFLQIPLFWFKILCKK